MALATINKDALIFSSDNRVSGVDIPKGPFDHNPKITIDQNQHIPKKRLGFASPP